MTSFSVLVSFLVSYFCHNEAEMSSEHLRVLFFFQEQTGTLCMRSVNSLELSGIMADQSSLFPGFFSRKRKVPEKGTVILLSVMTSIWLRH